MMWATLCPYLQGVITNLCLDATDPLFQGSEWRVQQKAFVAPSVQMSLDLEITSSTEGSWGTRYAYDPAGNGGQGKLTAKIAGQREFVLNVQIKSYDTRFEFWALEYAERIRTRIGRDDIVAELTAHGVTVWQASRIVKLDGVEDGQALSVCNLDLFARAGFEDPYPDDGTGLAFFRSVEIKSKISGGTPDPYGAVAGATPADFTLDVPDP
jgi:hypothetical protein